MILSLSLKPGLTLMRWRSKSLGVDLQNDPNLYPRASWWFPVYMYMEFANQWFERKKNMHNAFLNFKYILVTGIILFLFLYYSFIS